MAEETSYIIVKDEERVRMIKAAFSTAIDQINDLEQMVLNQEFPPMVTGYKVGKLYAAMELIMNFLNLLPQEEVEKKPITRLSQEPAKVVIKVGDKNE